MRITRLFVLLALAALLAPRVEASRTGVWESNPPAAAVLGKTDTAGLLAPLAPAGSLENTAADTELAEPQRFALGDVVLVESPREERFRLDLSDVVEPPALRGPPPLDEDSRQAFELCDPENRIRGFELLPPFRIGASPSLSLWGRQACGFVCREVASDSRYDPWGLARQTANGGSNWMGDLLNEIDLSSDSSVWKTLGAIVGDAAGNTVSDLLGLDTIADTTTVAADSSRSTGERVLAAGKGLGTAALDVAGGEILGTAGKVLTKVPGVSKLIAKVANSKVGKILATDVGDLARGAIQKVKDPLGIGDLTNAAGAGLNESLTLPQGVPWSPPRSGGPHRLTKAGGKQFGTESHHLIADAASDLATDEAPALRMAVPEHWPTGSHGRRGLAGREFRKAQGELVNQGRYDEALRMGVEDVRKLHGSRYDAAIDEMRNLLPRKPDGSVDWSKIKRK